MIRLLVLTLLCFKISAQHLSPDGKPETSEQMEARLARIKANQDSERKAKIAALDRRDSIIDAGKKAEREELRRYNERIGRRNDSVAKAKSNAYIAHNDSVRNNIAWLKRQSTFSFDSLALADSLEQQAYSLHSSGQSIKSEHTQAQATQIRSIIYKSGRVYTYTFIKDINYFEYMGGRITMFPQSFNRNEMLILRGPDEHTPASHTTPDEMIERMESIAQGKQFTIKAKLLPAYNHTRKTGAKCNHPYANAVKLLAVVTK